MPVDDDACQYERAVVYIGSFLSFPLHHVLCLCAWSSEHSALDNEISPFLNHQSISNHPSIELACIRIQ